MSQEPDQLRNAGKRQVNKLIAGPGVYICNECVDRCVEIIAQERPKT